MNAQPSPTAPPSQAVDLDILKQSSRLVHYCATPLLFDPAFRRQIQDEQLNRPPAKVTLLFNPLAVFIVILLGLL